MGYSRIQCGPSGEVPSGNKRYNLNNPFSHGVPAFPGIPASHFIKSNDPSLALAGFA